MRTGLWDQLAEIKRESNVPVMVGTLSLILVLLAFVILVPAATKWIATLETFLLFDVGLVYVFSLLFCMVAIAILGISPWGRIVLGGEDATPEYNNTTYFAMVLSVGIAAGIAFFGPAESIIYLTEVPPGISESASPSQIGPWGMSFALTHWGIVTSTTTAVFSIPIAYYCYRRGTPFRVSSALYPIVKGRPVLAGVIDILSVAALVLGISSSTMEVTRNFLAGIEFQWGITYPESGVVIFIIGIALVYTTSAVTGLDRGIPRISLISLGTFIIVTTATLVLGPTGAILGIAAQATLAQPAHFKSLALNIQTDWAAIWSIFNWAIWFALSAGYGLFTARISRGRTIREVIGYTVLASGAANMIWFYIVGGAVLQTQITGEADIIGLVTEVGPEIAGYPMLLSLPVGELFLFLFLGLGLLFIINSADSQTLSVAMMSSQDTANPPRMSRFFWGATMGITAIVLIVVGGNESVGSLAVVSGFFMAIGAVAALSTLLLSLWRADDLSNPD
jgi:choline-glycine betaine transporter